MIALTSTWALLPQGLSEAAGSNVRVSFTPHLMPFSRGMESDCYVRMTSGTSVDDLRSALQQQYAEETFVQVSCRFAVSKRFKPASSQRAEHYIDPANVSGTASL
jgi:N-acetyl-gamma-glutamyl-phosphate reductase